MGTERKEKVERFFFQSGWQTVMLVSYLNLALRELAGRGFKLQEERDLLAKLAKRG